MPRRLLPIKESQAVLSCPGCGENYKRKNGRRKGVQNWLCKECGRQFVEAPQIAWAKPTQQSERRRYPKPGRPKTEVTPDCIYCSGVTRKRGFDKGIASNARYECCSCKRTFNKSKLEKLLTRNQSKETTQQY